MKKFLCLALLSAALVGCSDDKSNEPDAPEVNKEQVNSIFVINQGNYYSQIDGSLTDISYTNHPDGHVTEAVMQNAFQSANGRSLGASPQCGIVYGSKMYIGVYESNVIEVVDAKTLKSIKQISLASETGQMPRSFVATGGKVYASMYNGYVSRLDTLSLSIDASVKVGPNPEVMALKGDKLYVPNSDGMNWEQGYGRTASVVDVKSMTVTKTIEVGLNPTKFVSNGTDLFLLCMGDYYMESAKVYRLTDSDKMEYIDEATFISMSDKNLYYINAPFGAEKVYYGRYNLSTKTKSEMVDGCDVEWPLSLDVDSTSGLIVIGSAHLEMEYPSYTTDGYVKVYRETDEGIISVGTYNVGVSPLVAFFSK